MRTGSLLFLGLATVACGSEHASAPLSPPTTDAQSGDAVSYARDVMPVWRAWCAQCHSGGSARRWDNGRFDIVSFETPQDTYQALLSTAPDAYRCVVDGRECLASHLGGPKRVSSGTCSRKNPTRCTATR